MDVEAAEVAEDAEESVSASKCNPLRPYLIPISVDDNVFNNYYRCAYACLYEPFTFTSIEVSMSNTEGEKTEIKPNFFLFTRTLEDKRRLLSLQNTSEDTQFNLCYTFNDAAIEALGDTVEGDDGKFAISVYPGEKKQFVQGTFKGAKRSLNFGAPDAEWQKRQAVLNDKEVQAETLKVKLALKNNPKADGKYTAEYISEVCIGAGIGFVDLTFAPREQSIARDFETPKAPTHTWMRPKVYCTETPSMFVGDIEPNDIDQGALGDCYFMCALACISEFPHLVRELFSAQQFPELGCYSVRCCKNGWWQNCVIDDLMPVNPASKIPLFGKNREEPHELWVSLIEKAYAKLHGSYAAIRSGDQACAVADMIGGPYRRFNSLPGWVDRGDDIWSLLRQWDDEDQLLTLSTPGVDLTAASGTGGSGSNEAKSLAAKYEAVGLCTGHAFSLISVVEIEGHRLCKIRNPWGNDKEWNGDWSDDSALWTPAMKKALNFVAAADGTFWMSWKDVSAWFDNGSVTYVLPSWSQVRVAGNFEAGCPDVVLQVTVTETTNIWTGLHQRDTRGVPAGDKDAKYVGLMTAVVKVNEKGKMEKIASNPTFATSRDVFCDATLEPSKTPYYIIAQAYSDTDKSYTQSLFVENTKGVSVSFINTADGVVKKKYNPVTTFEPSLYTQRVAAQYQLLVASQKVRVPHVVTGDSVNWSATPKPTETKTVSAPSPSTPSSGVSAAPQSGPTKVLNLSITVLAGRDLVSKDRNGLSDPFVTIKILDETGTRYPNIEKKSTKYINETLNPVWGETFQFQVKSTDQVFCACWDKDIFGKDSMGTVTIPIPSLGLQPRGEGKMGYYPLTGDDATGDIQLLFNVVV